MVNSVKTFLKQVGKDYQNQSVNPPVVRASTILFKTLQDIKKTQSNYKKNPLSKNFDYGRKGTSTTFALQELLRKIENNSFIGMNIIDYKIEYLDGREIQLSDLMKSIEEKTSRIIEIIISSVSSFKLMTAKIIGVGLVGFTQFFIWIFVITVTSVLLLNNLVPDIYSSTLQSQNPLTVNTGESAQIIEFLLYKIWVLDYKMPDS